RLQQHRAARYRAALSTRLFRRASTPTNRFASYSSFPSRKDRLECSARAGANGARPGLPQAAPRSRRTSRIGRFATTRNYLQVSLRDFQNFETFGPRLRSDKTEKNRIAATPILSA